MSRTAAAWAVRYVAKYHLALVPIPKGVKGPMYEGWNLPGGYVVDAAEAQRRWSTDDTQGIGAVLAPSGLCSLDCDTPEHTEPVLVELGIDLGALRKSAPTIQGAPTRYRVMFRAPPGVALGRKTLVWPARQPGEKPLTLFELRAGDIQDVLPPTVHPDTRRPYIWLNPPNSEFPPLPPALLELWVSWESYRRELEAMCPWSNHGFTHEPAPRGNGARPNVIATFNAAHPVEELLEAHGYTRRGANRWMSPTSSSGLAGVVMLDGRAFSHHASDPLADGHSHDAFDLFRILDHGGDMKSAVKAAGEELGMGSTAAGAEAHQDATDEAEDLDATVRRLAALSPIEYDRVRQTESDALGVRVTTLDAEVAKVREALHPSDETGLQGQAVVFDEPELWPDEVDGAEVLNGVSDTFTNYLGQPDGAANAMALWVAHAHCHMAFLHTPRLNITAPEKNCGKTLTLDVLHSLVPKAIRTEGITTAVLFRLVEKYAPTLLVDEYDAFIHDNEELRSAFNAGHKRGGVHLRCEGDKNEVRGFRTFAPVALAGIRDLPGTLADRSIIIHMQRLAPGEQRAPFDSRRTEPEKILCRKLARWTRDNFKTLEAADPDMPVGAGHRVHDNWRPLFAIADQAGGAWPARVRKAFVLLGKPDDAVRSRAEMLLSDFRGLFAKHGDRILSADAVGYLVEMEERPWPEYSRGKPITTRQVAAALRRFGIKPNLRRTGEVARGYDKSDFINPFARYLPPVSPEGGDPNRYTATTASGRHSSDSTSVTPEEFVTDRDPPQPVPRPYHA